MGTSLDERALSAAHREFNRAYTKAWGSGDNRTNCHKSGMKAAITAYLTQTRAQSAPEMLERLFYDAIIEWDDGAPGFPPFEAAKKNNTDAYKLARKYALRADAPPGWLPIETAPKDGTEILLAVYHENFVDPIIMNSCWIDREERGCYWLDWHGMPEPTHWMPLPESPLSAASPPAVKEET